MELKFEIELLHFFQGSAKMFPWNRLQFKPDKFCSNYLIIVRARHVALLQIAKGGWPKKKKNAPNLLTILDAFGHVLEQSGQIWAK